jgi:hypothetical protein
MPEILSSNERFPWTALREYIAAEIELGLRRQIHYAEYRPCIGFDAHQKRIAELEQQSTRMETAIREAIEVNTHETPAPQAPCVHPASALFYHAPVTGNRGDWRCDLCDTVIHLPAAVVRTPETERHLSPSEAASFSKTLARSPRRVDPKAAVREPDPPYCGIGKCVSWDADGRCNVCGEPR